MLNLWHIVTRQLQCDLSKYVLFCFDWYWSFFGTICVSVNALYLRVLHITICTYSTRSFSDICIIDEKVWILTLFVSHGIYLRCSRLWITIFEKDCCHFHICMCLLKGSEDYSLILSVFKFWAPEYGRTFQLFQPSVAKTTDFSNPSLAEVWISAWYGSIWICLNEMNECNVFCCKTVLYHWGHSCHYFYIFPFYKIYSLTNKQFL